MGRGRKGKKGEVKDRREGESNCHRCLHMLVIPWLFTRYSINGVATADSVPRKRKWELPPMLLQK